MKNYLILSNDLITINDNIDSILKELKLTFDNVIKFDMSETLLDKVIEELNTYGLFTENKVVILTSCSFLSTDKKRGDLTQNEELLIEYVKNPNPSNSLIIICEKLDDRKKINKLIKSNFIVLENNLSISEKVKKHLEDFDMNDKTINYLIDYLNSDNSKIMNELEKLKLYKIEEKNITIDDINKIVVKELNDDIFTLINYIVKKDINKSLQIYKELTSRGEDITKIVISVTDQFRLIYKTKILINEGKGKDFIASLFKIHPYRVKLAMEYSYNFTNQELLQYLNRLGNIDIGIKTGDETSKYSFELFLLSI